MADEMIPNAAERWERYEELWDNSEGDDAESEKTFALRADGAVVFFDAYGWFTMEWRDAPTKEEGFEGKWIYACDPDGTAHDVYCEPVWLAVYIDSILEA